MPPTNEDIDALLAHWDEDEDVRRYQLDRTLRKQIGSCALTRLSEGLRGRELYLQVREDIGSPVRVGFSIAVLFLIVKMMVLIAELWFLSRNR